MKNSFYQNASIEQQATTKEDLDNSIILDNYENRTIIINKVITDDILETVTEHILKWNKEDMDVYEGTIEYVSQFCDEEHIDKNKIAGIAFKPIILKVSSCGGSVWDGLGLINAMQNSRCPIITINMSKCLSMGALILMSGHLRYSMPDAITLIHDGQFGDYDSTHKVIDYSKHMEEMNERIKNLIVDSTKITEELYKEKERVEWYIFPEQAKELGIIDGIIGKDMLLEDLL